MRIFGSVVAALHPDETKRYAVSVQAVIDFMEESIINNFVLRTAGLSKKVSSPEGTLTILDDITLEIGAGEIVALIGPSGAGKTTLLALLAGLDRPTTGQVWLCDEDLTALNEDGRARVRGEHVGFVFQSFHLVPSLTAVENVMLPLELAADPAARPKARAALASVGLDARKSHYPKQLSGGEKQRVAIARAFVTQPDILFADEPTGNLDTASGEKIANLLFDMNRQSGTTLVLVTHDRQLAARCDRILELEAGVML
jgi:putative ABC transport system ATP-binding protein